MYDCYQSGLLICKIWSRGKEIFSEEIQKQPKEKFNEKMKSHNLRAEVPLLWVSIKRRRRSNKKQKMEKKKEKKRRRREAIKEEVYSTF